jgi:hypothetical protein
MESAKAMGLARDLVQATDSVMESAKAMGSVPGSVRDLVTDLAWLVSEVEVDLGEQVSAYQPAFLKLYLQRTQRHLRQETHRYLAFRHYRRWLGLG